MDNINKNVVRVLTYNLWCHRFVGGWNSAQRLNTFTEWLLNDTKYFYDIVCLQEVFTCNPFFLFNYGAVQRANLIGKLKSKYPYSYTADTPWFSIQDSGCLVFSAHKMEPCHQESFSSSTFSESLTNKGYMCCKVTFQKKQVFVINTHLNAGAQTSIRERQLKQIDNHITSCHAGHRVILCGDLNICYGSREYNCMMQSFVVNRLTDSTPNATATYARLVRLDYILTNQYFTSTSSAVVSADAKNQNNSRSMVSDHEGLVVSLKFNNIDLNNTEMPRILASNKNRTRQLNGMIRILVVLILFVIVFYCLIQL